MQIAHNYTHNALSDELSSGSFIKCTLLYESRQFRYSFVLLNNLALAKYYFATDSRQPKWRNKQLEKKKKTSPEKRFSLISMFKCMFSFHTEHIQRLFTQN